MSPVYVSIGNSDDKLTQLDWYRFVNLLQGAVRLESSQVYGVWFSEPASQYQNMCMAAEVDKRSMTKLRKRLAGLAADFRQDSIALAVATTTEFVRAVAGDSTVEATNV